MFDRPALELHFDSLPFDRSKERLSNRLRFVYKSGGRHVAIGNDPEVTFFLGRVEVYVDNLVANLHIEIFIFTNTLYFEKR